MGNGLVRIGILSHYFNSHNYGGNLQTYAFCQLLVRLGYDAQQVAYQVNTLSSKVSIFERIKRQKSVKQLIQSVFIKTMNKFFRAKFSQRNLSIARFNAGIPHSENIYTVKNILDCTDYDIYITGSDQVWNPDWTEETTFLLDFVPEGKKKLAYAASIGKKELTKEQQEVFREKLADFAAVSVREEDAVDLLRELSPVPVVQTLDPTLLLTREQWDEVCSERLIPEKYIFTYFLGADTNQRNVATEFAKKKGLPIVTLPFLEGAFRKCDAFFGDKKLYDISPADFVSLIKHAEYVLTDSFHACVFSSIYQKEFFAFQRLGHAGMGGRLYSLTKLFHSEDHFCDIQERATLNYIENLEKIDYAKPHPELDSMRTQSFEFLRRNLTNAG